MGDQAGGPPVLRILHVEDNVAHARLVEACLDQCGLRVEVARTGRLAGAVDRLATERFDLVIVDLHLPDAQGLTVVEQLQALVPDVPLVVATALDDTELSMSGMSSGVQEWLPKDRITPDLLRTAVVGAVARHRHVVQMRREMLTDPATGLLTATAFRDAAARLRELAIRRGSPLAVVHFDLGDPGHVTTFGPVLADVVRDSDVVGRSAAAVCSAVLVDDDTDPPRMLTRLEQRLRSAAPGLRPAVHVRRLAAEHPVELDDLLWQEAATGEERPLVRRLRVLVVASDAGVRTALVEAAARTNVVTLEAAHAAQALRVAMLEQPDVVLVDLHLESGGESLARELTEQFDRRRLAVVMVTRPEDQWGVVSAKARGVAGRIEMPVSDRELAVTLHDVTADR